MFSVYHLTVAVDLFFGQISHTSIRVNSCALQNLTTRREANSVDIRQRNLHTFVTRNVNPGNSSHLSLQCLPLLLLMLGVFATNDHYNTLAADDLAVLTTWFHRCA